MSAGIVNAGFNTLKWVAIAVHLHMNPEDAWRVNNIMPIEQVMSSVAPLRGDTLTYTYNDWEVNFVSVRAGMAEPERLNISHYLFTDALSDDIMDTDLFHEGIKMSYAFDGLPPDVFVPLLMHTMSQIDQAEKAGMTTWTAPVRDNKSGKTTGLLSLTKSKKMYDTENSKTFTYFMEDEDSANRAEYARLIHDKNVNIQRVNISGDHGSRRITLTYTLNENLHENDETLI